MNHRFTLFEGGALASSFVLFCCGCSSSFVSAARVGLSRLVSQGVASRLVALDGLTDMTVQSGIMLLVYVLQYAVLGGLFEGTHPNGALSSSLAPVGREKRRAQVSSEIGTGVVSLVVTVAIAIAWMAFVDPRLPFYGYFEAPENLAPGEAHHPWHWGWAALGLVAYVAAFDTWFYWTHWALHNIEPVWQRIHRVHHKYKEPSAFAQFAVHPFEAALQGPIGHFAVTLFCPVHPLQLAILGFLSSAWAFAAHDGRAGDFNSHYYHHAKGRGRLAYFNLGFLTPAWDVIMGTRWSEDHPLWVKWKAEAGTKQFDTADGTKDGEKNDTFDAYAQGSVHESKFKAS